MRIESWALTQSAENVDDVAMLAAVLHSCVCGGASVSFVLPFSIENAEAFWRDDVLPAVAAGDRRLLVARTEAGRIVGSVQLDLATPPNQPHRAEVRKLLVHPDARRMGIARSMMLMIEKEAATAKRTLLTLDTVTGGRAEALYRSLGYCNVGIIPGYALNFDSSRLEATTVMYKELTNDQSKGSA